MEQHLKT